MSEMLSRDDIDSLLSAVVKPGHPRYYDWKHPLAFSHENIRILQEIHEIWNRLSSLSLSTQTDCRIEVTVASIDQLTWLEFIRSIPSPSLIATITLEPLMGAAVLEFDPAVAFPLVDLMMGGDGQRMKGPDRELSLIEQNLMEGLIVGLLGKLREAWSGLLDLRPRLANMEVRPHLVRAVGSHEPVVLVTSQVRIGDEAEGMMNFCLPWLSAASVEAKLRYTALHEDSRRVASSADLKTIQDHLFSRPVSIRGDFALDGPPLTLAELCQLKKWQGSRLQSADYVLRTEEPRHE